MKPIPAIVSALLLWGAPDVSAADVSALMSSMVEEMQEWRRSVSIEPLSFVKTQDSSNTRLYRAHGVAVCMLRVSNISSDTHTVRLSTGSPHAIQYQQECRLDPQQSAIVCFKLLPVERSSAFQVNVEIDGTPKGWLHFAPFPTRFESYLSNRQLMLSPSMTQAAIAYRAETWSSTDRKSVSSWMQEWSFLEGQVPVSEWPDQWLAYTPADCIILTKEEWDTIPQDVRSALQGYLQTGGGLILAGASQDDIKRLDIPAGLGTVSAISSAVPGEWTREDFNVLRAAIDSSASQWSPLLSRGAEYPTDRFFSVPPLVPVYAMLLCVMLFLGPVLLVILALRNKRIHLYWLAPCIAGAVSVIILVFALFRDGVSPTTRAQSVLYLNETSLTQVQLTTLSLMAPAGLYSPLRFPASAEVTPAPSNQKFSTGRRTVRNDGDLILNSAWVPSRVPITFLMRDTGPLSVAILRFEGGQVTNPYPTPIQQLLYYDAEGRCFALVAPLPPGATATLRHCSPAPQTFSRDLVRNDIKRAFFSADSIDKVGTPYFLPSPQSPLPPNTYLCVLEGTPFLKHPIQGKARHQGKTIVLGELTSIESNRVISTRLDSTR